MADPFAGVLERSSAAQALRDARASLSRPLRPFTPASRSLFEGTGSSSSHSGLSPSTRALGALKPARDAFACERAKESMASTRSSFGFVPAFQVISELEEPDLQLADVLEQGQAGVVIREGHVGETVFTPETRRKPESATAVAFGRFNAGPDEEYEGGGVDDLALCMDVPAWSDDSGSEDEGSVLGRAPAEPSVLVAAAEREAPKEDSPKRLLADLGSSGAGLVRSDAAQLERLGGLADRLVLLVDQGTGAPELFKASLLLLEQMLKLSAESASHVPLVKISSCLLQQLRRDSVRAEVPPRGLAATSLNVAKTLFKLSKDASLDAQFGERGLVPLLVKGLQDACGGGQPSDCQVLVAGILKNVSNDERNQQLMLGSDILGVIHELLQSGDEQLLIQITALLRNLLSSPEHHEDFLATGSLSQLASAMSQHRQCRELQVNIARVLGKLSGCDDTSESMLEHVDVLLEPICRSLSDHCGVTSLVTRLAFVLGSFTAIDEDARQKFACELGGIPLLTSLLEKYWQQEQNLRPGSCEEAAAALDGTAAAECEECLVKLVRLVANLTISRDAGVTLASTGSVVGTLLGILSTKRIVNSEELVLNALAAVTNLTFHESEQNLLLSAENKRLLCQLMQPMLLESYNVEALVECARALGNVSRHEDVRQWMVELRIDEVLSILLSHHDRDLVFYSCGAFVNLAADPDVSKHLREGCGLLEKLAAVLQESDEDDTRMMLVATKVLANLLLEQSEPSDGPCATQALCDGLRRVVELHQPPEEPSKSSPRAAAERKALLDLSSHLLGSLLPPTGGD